MLAQLNPTFRILAKAPPAGPDQIQDLQRRFPDIPQDFKGLCLEATEIEIQHTGGSYLRIWGPDGCVEMDDAYNVSKRIPGALPVGDDGGGRALVYMKGVRGYGLYIVGFGAMDVDEATWLAVSLQDLLVSAAGVDRL